MTILLSKLPPLAKDVLRWVRGSARSLFYAGKRRYCPICERTSRIFLNYGRNPRKGAQCPHCGSLERHRFLWLYLKARTNIFDGSPYRMLHVAPESCLKERLAKLLGSGYMTADLHDPSAMVKMDVCNIQFPDESFHIIYCCHVLEHVEDDRRAMREFRRILSKDGWAILLVPIYSDKTFEDPSVTDPLERLRLFGQEDHVRRYGPDYADRLREAGFSLRIVKISDMFAPDEAKRMGLTAAAGDIYFCTKTT